MAELSIIVPVYKVEKYLPKCIDSILAQTFRDFELILIDDGSPDNCGAICDEYAARDSRIKVIHQENAGVSAARNAGLDIATGTYLGFVDSDDWIESEMYETMIATAKEKQVDVVVCGFRIFKDDGSYIGRSNACEGIFTSEQLHASIYTVPNPLDGVCWNKLFLRERIENICFPVDIPRYEDTIYLFNCFLSCRHGYKIKTHLYNVVERVGSATRSDNLDLELSAVRGSHTLYLLHQKSKFSIQLRTLATDKVLYDCIRYGTNIRHICLQDNKKDSVRIWHIKLLMFRIISRAYFQKLLPKSKIHGYIMGMLKL